MFILCFGVDLLKVCVQANCSCFVLFKCFYATEVCLFIHLFFFFQPENIFLQKDNSVKIGDFGLAKGCISEEEEAQSAAFLNGMPKHAAISRTAQFLFFVVALFVFPPLFCPKLI